MPKLKRRVPADQPRTPEPNAPEPRTDGLGRVLITVYLILALAATLRAVYQIVSKFHEAPVAYSLSLVSGLVYILATIALLKRAGVWRTVAWAALCFELAGVLLVGTLSLTVPEFFAHDSVWSYYGSGYLFVPLILPIMGMIWLSRTRDAGTPAEPAKQTEARGSQY